MMNAGDYETVAAAFAESEVPGKTGRPDLWRDFVLDMADKFCATSERFDPLRFANTCDCGVFTWQDVAEYSHALHLRMTRIKANQRRASEQTPIIVKPTTRGPLN